MGPYTKETAERHNYWLHRERLGEMEFIDRYAKKTCGPILELASGAARVTKELARRGHTVYGLEMSPSMLDKAREVVGRMDTHIQDRIRLVQGDMTRFSFGRKFPLIVIPFYSFWHNLDKTGPADCVRCMVDHLAPGGLFMVEGEHAPFAVASAYGLFWTTMSKSLGFQYRYEKYVQNPHENSYLGSSFLIGERP